MLSVWSAEGMELFTPAIAEMLPTLWVAYDADTWLTFTTRQYFSITCVSFTTDQQGLGYFIFLTEMKENSYFCSVFALFAKRCIC